MTLLLTIAALPWILSLVLRFTADSLDHRFTPPTAVVMLPVLASITAFSVAASMVALSAVLLSSRDSAVHVVVGAAVLGWVIWRSIQVARHARRVVVSSAMASKFGVQARSTGGIVLVDSPEPDAFAVPSGGGAIVVTTALAEALTDSELCAVIEHERAHLCFHHTLWIQLCEVAAQFDPVLRPIVGHVRHAAERQADETAAVHGRAETLSAVTRTALLRTHLARTSEPRTLASTGGDVIRRVRALTEPPPPRQRRTVVIAGLVLILAFSAISAALFDVAQDVVVPEAGETPTSVFR